MDSPTYFEALLKAAGADPVPYPYKLRCCGGALMVTDRQAALRMLRDVLQSAVDARAVSLLREVARWFGMRPSLLWRR